MSTAHISNTHRRQSSQLNYGGYPTSIDYNTGMINHSYGQIYPKLPTPTCTSVYSANPWGSVPSNSSGFWSQDQPPSNHWMYYGMNRSESSYYEPSQSLPQAPTGLNVYNTNALQQVYQNTQNTQPVIYMPVANQKYQRVQPQPSVGAQAPPMMPVLPSAQPPHVIVQHPHQMSNVTQIPQTFPVQQVEQVQQLAQPLQGHTSHFSYPYYPPMGQGQVYNKPPQPQAQPPPQSHYQMYGKPSVVSANFAPSQAYQNISSPSSSFIDAEYDVPLASKFITTVANNTSPKFKLSISELSNFESFVKNILCATHLSKSTMLLSLVLLTRFVKHQDLPIDLDLRSLISVSFVLANKSNDDNTFTNSSWSSVTGLAPATITKLELQLLDLLNWKLTLDDDGLGEWAYWNDCWHQYGANMKTGYPLSPVSPKEWTYGSSFGSVAVC